jgi:hypothetical protein
MMAKPVSSPLSRSGRAVFGAAALLLAANSLGAQNAVKALSLTEVIDLRAHGVSSRQILRSAREYCIAFSMDDTVRRKLTVAGADTLLVGGLSNVCSTAKPPEPPPPQPIVDDAFAQTNTSEGFTWSNPRCKARFESEGVRMENTGTDALCMVRYPSAEMPGDVRVDLEVSQLGLSSRGSILLGFGRQERSGNYYSMSVSADRKVELCWNVGRTCNSLVTLANVAAVESEPTAVNHVAVEVRGQEIVLFVNDKRIGQFASDAAVGGRLMLGVGPQTSVVLVRLRATPLR